MNKRFKPQYLPYNNDAHALVEALAVELGLSLKGITGAKHKTILASFLYCVQEAGVGAYLDWSCGSLHRENIVGTVILIVLKFSEEIEGCSSSQLMLIATWKKHYRGLLFGSAL